jgi:hypothetical protein
VEAGGHKSREFTVRIKIYRERLIANANAELAMATYARDLERVDLLTKRIAEYELKIKEASK